jgi:hypothetical protein
MLKYSISDKTSTVLQIGFHSPCCTKGTNDFQVILFSKSYLNSKKKSYRSVSRTSMSTFLAKHVVPSIKNTIKKEPVERHVRKNFKDRDLLDFFKCVLDV